MSIQSISIWKFHMDFPYPYGLWIESLVVVVGVVLVVIVGVVMATVVIW